MELIEGGLVGSHADGMDLPKDLSLLQEFGIRRVMFPDYFSLKRFSQLIEDVELFSYHFDVLNHPKKESIKMTWDILKSYDSSTIFIRQDRFAQDDEGMPSTWRSLSLMMWDGLWRPKPSCPFL